MTVDAIHRIVEGECAASGSPKPPTFELYDHYPVNDNDTDATATVAGAFQSNCGDGADCSTVSAIGTGATVR
jgi:hippurate hydrolase